MTSETYCTPGIGRFNDDDVLDVFSMVSEGTWPDYKTRAIALWIDGVTGQVIREVDCGVFASGQPLIVDSISCMPPPAGSCA